MKTPPTIKYIHIPLKIYPLALKEFKVYVDRSRFQEGQKLFSESRVFDLKLEKGRGKAFVKQGEQTFHIHFQLHQHGSNVCCSCEAFQDWELLCPHLVATILFLNQQEPVDGENKSSTKEQENPTAKQKTLAKSIENWLSIKLPNTSLIGELRPSHLTEFPFEILFRREQQPLVTVHLPNEYVPELLRDQRSLADLLIHPNLEKYQVLRDKDIRPILEAKLTRNHQLQLFLYLEIAVPSKGPIRCKWDLLKKNYLGKSWIQWRHYFLPVPIFPPALKPFFNGKKPLDYAAEMVPQFLLEELPALRELTEFESPPQIREAQVIRHAPLHFQLTSTNENGWFYLDPRYGTEQHSISLQTLLHHATQKSQEIYIQQDNIWFEVQNPVYRSLSRYFQEKGIHFEKTFSKKYQIPELLQMAEEMGTQLDDVPLQFQGEDQALHFLEGKFDSTVHYPIPKSLKGGLRPYQIEGFRWLRQLFDWGLHGILADDMGLGKTHQALALLCSVELLRKEQKQPSLIICPTSVLPHWEAKIKAFAPELTMDVFHQNHRQNCFQQESPPSVVLTTYGLLARDPALLEPNWFVVILDEAQKIKNPSTQVSKKARQLKSRYRLALTGTPIENRLEELWTIFDFLMPGYLGSLKEFQTKYETATPQKESHQLLLNKIRPFKIRRVKSQVLSDLPEKIENKRYVDLTDIQIQLYKQVLRERGDELKKNIQRVRSNKEIPYLHIFSVLTRLKQICDHPRLLGEEGTSGKYEYLLEMLQDCFEQGKKIVIFSHFVKMIDIFEEHFTAQNISYRTLTGATRDRKNVIQEFQENPEIKVFLCSLLAGGLGIDLTACDTVFHYDRWWNAAREDQATDRVHRIGQTRGVMVHKLITRGTLEEKIDSLILEKKNLANSIIEMDDGSHLAKLSREQLLDLLTLEETETF